MIEKKEAVANIEEICSIPGADMIQFGPSDYSMSQGWNACDHKEEIAATEQYCIEVALAHGVQPRVEIQTAEDAERYRKMGVKHFCIGDEFNILRNYWTTVGGMVRRLTMENV